MRDEGQFVSKIFDWNNGQGKGMAEPFLAKENNFRPVMASSCVTRLEPPT